MGLKESALAADLIGYMGPHARQHDLGIVAGADGTLRLMPRLVRIPDVSFIAWQQLPEKVYPSEPIPDLYPDLAVEVLSEGNTPAEMRRKLKESFLSGVRLVWFVDPRARTVRVFTAPDQSVTMAEGATLGGGEVLPGFTLSVSAIFQQLPAKPGKRRHPRRADKGSA